MVSRSFARPALLPLLFTVAMLTVPATLKAQGNGQNGQNLQGVAGVAVDANGVLSVLFRNDATGELTRQQIEAAKATLDPKLAGKSPLRKISLNRLERAIAAQLAAGRPLSGEMQYLAGMTRIQFVFCYPESGDIVIAGPAEGWFQDLAGRPVALSSGRPVLELQDLIVALRAYPPGQRQGPVIGCSIDPTPEGLANMQQFLRQIGSRATPADTEFIVNGLRTSLGLQQVRVLGVPPDTHFAQVMVEADYRMKLIGIGLERPPVKLASYVDKADPAQVSRNALQRWFFTPDYECVRVSGDRMAMELVGDGVKLVGENEVVGADGQRKRAGSTNRASELFVQGFTRKYPELARKSPVYAQLRNLIDMAVAAAFIQQEDYYSQTGWSMETLGNEALLSVETYQTPVQVDSAVASVWKGNRLMTPVGGGVHIEAETALDPSHLLQDKKGKVHEHRLQTRLDHLAEGQWWWD